MCGRSLHSFITTNINLTVSGSTNNDTENHAKQMTIFFSTTHMMGKYWIVILIIQFFLWWQVETKITDICGLSIRKSWLVAVCYWPKEQSEEIQLVFCFSKYLIDQNTFLSKQTEKTSFRLSLTSQESRNYIKALKLLTF